jgi:butyrate kinase
MVIGEGGYVAYLGTNDALEVSNRVQDGDQKAAYIQEALGYQVSKSIGEMAVVLNGYVDAIILTGGLAHNKYLTNYITSKVEFISAVYIYPGEDELEALASNALRVATGEIEPLEYLN